MTTWDEIRDEVAGMLADGQPLENVITKLEKRKNEMAKANLLKAMDEMKNPKPMTNEEWFCGLNTEEKAEFSMRVFKNCTWCLDGGLCPFNEFPEHCPAESKENMMKWLKEKHTE